MTPAVFQTDAIAWIDAVSAVTGHLIGVIAFLGLAGWNAWQQFQITKNKTSHDAAIAAIQTKLP